MAFGKLTAVNIQLYKFVERLISLLDVILLRMVELVNHFLQPFTRHIILVGSTKAVKYMIFQSFQTFCLFTMVFELWCFKSLFENNGTTLTKGIAFFLCLLNRGCDDVANNFHTHLFGFLPVDIIFEIFRINKYFALGVEIE